MVIPTYQERSNVRPIIARLEVVLSGIDWEVVFVDDDSPDGTAEEVRSVAGEKLNVRIYQRIGRRGLAGACIEGILSSVAPIVAVMDGDLQHDEACLVRMYEAMRKYPTLDLVIGSRHVADQAAGKALSPLRKWGSDRANALARSVLGIETTDPMSGFFMVRRSSFNTIAIDLQKHGFKILTDMLAVSRGRWTVLELPYAFRKRQRGGSKMGGAVALEFLGLLVSLLTGGVVPVRLALFIMVGCTGLAVQLSVVKLAFLVLGQGFVLAQGVGVFAAMTTNYILNNRLTYRDRSLRGAEFLRGLVSFYSVCSVGALSNVGVAAFVFAAFPNLSVASFLGAVVGALWNFWASLLFTWRAR